MEVLNAAGLTSISLHTNKRAQPRKLPPSIPLNPSSTPRPGFAKLISQGFTGGLGALSAALTNHGSAKALTYEEALGQTSGISVPSISSADFDVGGLLDGFSNFVSGNPLVIGGGALVLVVPLVLSQILKKPRAWGVESAKSAFATLAEDGSAQLLDIRGGKDFKEVGGPDLKSLKKKAVSVMYRGDDKQGFLKKLGLKFKDPSSTTLFILDKFDGNSELVAELLTANGFKAAFAIKDGAEGPRGWLNSGLPWTAPKKMLAFDFDGLKDTITSTLGGGEYGLPVTLGLAVATGLGVVAFSEIETVLQLLGSAAIIQFVTKKVLYAEDRKVTLKQIDDFLVTKVAPNELVDEIKMIGKVLLPASITPTASLPASVEVAPVTSASPTEEPKVDPTPDANTEVEVEVKVEVESAVDQPIVNSVPKAEVIEESKSAEVIEESKSAPHRPLSPYPYYPDFKPPTSPTPSPP